MINLIWMGMIAIGLLTAAFQGRMEAVNKALFEGAQTGVTVAFGLLSVLIFWMGMMKVAEASGLLDMVSALLRPLVRFLFPDVPANHPAAGYILSNMTANLFGLANAATPMGIKAMQELQKLNPNKDAASPAMCTLLALNTSSLTLIPTTVIAIRLSFDSANPTEIVGSTIVATLISTLSAVLLDKWYRYRHRIKGL